MKVTVLMIVGLAASTLAAGADRPTAFTCAQHLELRQKYETPKALRSFLKQVDRVCSLPENSEREVGDALRDLEASTSDGPLNCAAGYAYCPAYSAFLGNPLAYWSCLAWACWAPFQP